VSAKKRVAAKKKGVATRARRVTAKKKVEPKAPPAGHAWDWVFAPRNPGEKRYWLVKSEPEVFSFEQLLARPDRTTFWDGVRNYTARNFMRHGMKLGDEVLFYHSNAEPPAIVGVCEVVREGYPDHTALDRNDPHFDPGSNPGDPTWYMVDLKGLRPLPRPVPLPELRKRKELASMALLRIGRLSVTPVRPAEWDEIIRMAG
jgi:predicted RNA-binding protein with PUA-like domain